MSFGSVGAGINHGNDERKILEDYQKQMSLICELNAENRITFLLGRFWIDWSFLEMQINRSLQSAIKLNSAQYLILYTNMNLSAKIKTLQTLVNCLKISKAEMKKHLKVFNKLREIADIRDMFAHFPLHIDDDKNHLEVLIVKAGGKFKFPDEVFSYERFDQLQERMRALKADLKKINPLLESLDLQMSVKEESGKGKGLFGLRTEFLSSPKND